MIRSVRIICVIWAVCLLVPLQSLAAADAERVAKPSPGNWPQGVYHWQYNPRHAPAWLPPAAAREMVLRAAQAWAACGVHMAYGGETGRPPGRMDRVNVVGWSLDMPSRLRGITLGQAKAGQLIERDIAIRPDRLEFRHSPRLLQKVITHEFGHAIGLTHSTRCDDVMTLAADCPWADPETLPLALTENDLGRCRMLYPPESREK